jgi:hypothetical protein
MPRKDFLKSLQNEFMYTLIEKRDIINPKWEFSSDVFFICYEWLKSDGLFEAKNEKEKRISLIEK